MISDLPVFDFYDEITSLVDQNQVTIITAETGAGKSTQVPQYLAEHGYQKVIVTQPRILAARNLSRRVREEWAVRTGKDSDEVIGYRTAHERDDSPNTQILYCTDGLQLVREITGAGIGDRQVLVLDEVHEWNENMEVLVAWAKKRCQEEPRFKVVIMSATIETGSLAAFFDTKAVVTVPGRTHEVTKRRGSDVLGEIFNQLEQASKNILVFLPGKSEIQNVSDAISKKALEAGVPVIPLHSQLEATAQQEAFASYPNGKIILATNIAQTSVTIDDVDMVIDSGLARQSEVRSGVEGLFIAQTSQADCLQRAGRAGRTKSGEYVLAPFDTMPCLEFEERPEYSTPEIMRKHIDRLTLRLANVGIDIEQLDFYHDPSKKAIRRAKQTLIALGALTKNGEVTKIGRQMEQFPVESSFGRMIVEAKSYDDSVQSKLATIIAIQEVGGIVKGGSRYTGWRKYSRQTKSDLLAHYDVLLALPQMDQQLLEEIGIITKNVDKAEEVLGRLRRDLGLPADELQPINSDEQEPLMRSIVAGQIDQLWTADEHGGIEHIRTKDRRELSSSTVVRDAKLIAGTPFDLQVPTRGGGLETLHLVQGITAVKPEWLLELLPEQFDVRKSQVAFDPRVGGLVKRQQVRFGKQVLAGQGAPILEDSSENRKKFIREFSVWAFGQIERQRRNLGRFHRRVPEVSLQQVERSVKAQADGIISIDQLPKTAKRNFLSLSKIETYFEDDFYQRLGRPRRDNHETHKRRGWRPKHKRKFRDQRHRH